MEDAGIQNHVWNIIGNPYQKRMAKREGGKMSKNKIFKSVSFNITKPDDVTILEYLKRRNFSGYVKKLIWQDIKKQEEKKAHQEPVKKPSEPLTSAQKLEQVKNQLKATKDINESKPQ